ncbi:hypothetical protein BSKO_10261 [Bryopsis sp. KO-2023]|nr:hypothetical protein BSKO_10261 [Bryopsis sp. KO-2023]
MSSGQHQDEAPAFHDGKGDVDEPASNVRMIDVDLVDFHGTKRVSVLIDWTQQYEKLYLGGYHNKKTRQIYHHAVTQTSLGNKGGDVRKDIVCRDTQTVDVKTRGTQSLREAATQMDRPGLVLSDSNDRVVVAGEYECSDVKHAKRVAAAIVIQRYSRGTAARRRANHLRAVKNERDTFIRMEDTKRRDQAEAKCKKDIERRMYPKTAEDFEILHDELEAWRLKETSKTKHKMMDYDDEQTALEQLFLKETKLLQTIDRLRVAANRENKEERIQATLMKMSEPKKWDLSNGNKVLVHTPFTTRAKQLSQLYLAASTSQLTLEERLDVLLHIKWTVKEFDCDLTRQLVDLIDREADLLNRGRSPKTLDGLRKRICTLFLAFIETPEFNPEATRFTVPIEKPDAYTYANVERALARTALGQQKLYNTA